MSNIDKELAFAKAVETAAKRRIAELREDSDAEMMRAFNEFGATERPIMVEGKRVGLYKVPLSTPRFAIIDMEAFTQFAADNGLDSLIRYTIEPAENWQEFAELGADGAVYFAGTDAVLPGVVFEPARAKSPQLLGCKPEQVADALHIALSGDTFAGLLGGGSDD